jgi:hypothetical protein
VAIQVDLPGQIDISLAALGQEIEDLPFLVDDLALGENVV